MKAIPAILRLATVWWLGKIKNSIPKCGFIMGSVESEPNLQENSLVGVIFH